MTTSPFIARRRRALQAAADLLDELDVDQEQPVDVFEAIGRLGMWLVFQPLTSLLGAAIQQGPGGVLITTEREPTIQRYTAAHEIGHWRLDHNPTAFDTETDILSPGADERERLAQWFASYFLMPPPLVHSMVARHRSTGEAISPAKAYLIARDMCVSYEAALRQMANLDIISDRDRDDLLTVPRLTAMQAAAHGHRPEDGRANVWVLDERSLGHPSEHIDIVVNDEIVIALPENRTTGYQWLDEAANVERGNLQARAAPPPFAAPSLPARIPVQAPHTEPPHQTTADINAALALLPRATRPLDASTSPPSSRTASTTVEQSTEVLSMVADEYRPGWARVQGRDPGVLRQHIAGRPGNASALFAPAALPPDLTKPGVGATGQRLLALQARAEGRFTTVLYYAPIHDPHAAPAAAFTISAYVSPPPEILHRRALLNINLDVDEDDTATPTIENDQ
ncbi:ImmA/IrrE family metallo-endopeptidase [Saccharothrix deserti]|uniref:ImmA/IrrE family metallo-endopeptidase n=1 Tax=Saccharothrix deserti TaxID=2593674 RepID=UPI00131A82A3|nr:ImmA/IrrE family metallo-endopeptidase [Saccharothrix deserti]